MFPEEKTEIFPTEATGLSEKTNPVSFPSVTTPQSMTKASLAERILEVALLNEFFKTNERIN